MELIMKVNHEESWIEIKKPNKLKKKARFNDRDGGNIFKIFKDTSAWFINFIKIVVLDTQSTQTGGKNRDFSNRKTGDVRSCRNPNIDDWVF